MLAALTSPDDSPPPPTADPMPASDVTGISLSPYLVCMIDATRALIKDLNQPPKKAVLEAELRKYWPGDSDDLTSTDISAMATLMRLPESKKGRGAKRVSSSVKGDPLLSPREEPKAP